MKDYGHSPQMALLMGRYAFARDRIGQSPADVWILTNGKTGERLFLKISSRSFASTTYSVEREMGVLKWLDGKKSVPSVLDYFENENYQFLLTAPMAGTAIIEKKISPNDFIDSLAQGIRALQSVPLEDCPFDSSLDTRMGELKYLVKEKLAAFDDFYQAGLPFYAPEDLINYLESHRYPEEPVFSHGDYQDSNIFISDALGFIDWGRGGRADKWCDIAHACRNIKERWGDGKYTSRFFENLELEPDWERIRFQLWLDELF
ncbi:MAG: aminoglycoside 3'-phosphotransferase [Spirochaetales bacterium]|nr:aminoglycoside 3'-phosphotransferase [Spirochaetales bacterium]